MSGFGRSYRHTDGLGVTQLTDQDHVRILAHCGAHAFRETRDVRAQFTLDDLTGFTAVNEFDRILEADDVEPAAGVEQIDHGCERGGLAGAGRAGHQDHPLMVVAQLGYDRRQAELGEAWDFGRDGAKGGAQTGVLAVYVDAKAATFA